MNIFFDLFGFKCTCIFSADISSPAADVLQTRKRMDVLDSHMSYLDTGNVPGSDETGGYACV